VSRVAWRKGPRLLRLGPFRHASSCGEMLLNVRKLTDATIEGPLPQVYVPVRNNHRSCRIFNPVLKFAHLFFEAIFSDVE
jgi:hypothetical protein